MKVSPSPAEMISVPKMASAEVSNSSRNREFVVTPVTGAEKRTVTEGMSSSAPEGELGGASTVTEGPSGRRWPAVKVTTVAAPPVVRDGSTSA